MQQIISSKRELDHHQQQQQQQQQQRPIELEENGQQPKNSTMDLPSVYDNHHHPHHHHQQQHHHSEFELHTTLAPQYGGPLHPDCIDEAILVNETKDDVELRDHILMGLSLIHISEPTRRS